MSSIASVTLIKFWDVGFFLDYGLELCTSVLMLDFRLECSETGVGGVVVVAKELVGGFQQF